MALSDKKILEAKKEGSIVIEPFKRENLATSSYDVTLGEYFFREQPSKYNHSLYNIWSRSHMEHVWGADKVEKAVPAKEAFKKYNFTWEGISPSDKVIILKPGEGASAEELRAFCEGQIAYYKVPKYWHFTDAFPMTVTGKVQKYLMRDQAVNSLHLERAASIRTA